MEGPGCRQITLTHFCPESPGAPRVNLGYAKPSGLSPLSGDNFGTSPTYCSVRNPGFGTSGFPEAKNVTKSEVLEVSGLLPGAPPRPNHDLGPSRGEILTMGTSLEEGLLNKTQSATGLSLALERGQRSESVWGPGNCDSTASHLGPLWGPAHLAPGPWVKAEVSPHRSPSLLLLLPRAMSAEF